jgi:hypothetical protein
VRLIVTLNRNFSDVELDKLAHEIVSSMMEDDDLGARDLEARITGSEVAKLILGVLTGGSVGKRSLIFDGRPLRISELFPVHGVQPIRVGTVVPAPGLNDLD